MSTSAFGTDSGAFHLGNLLDELQRDIFALVFNVIQSIKVAYFLGDFVHLTTWISLPPKEFQIPTKQKYYAAYRMTLIWGCLALLLAMLVFGLAASGGSSVALQPINFP